MPDISPPRCAKLATFPKPNKVSTPIKPSTNQTIMNKYNAGGRSYLSNWDSSSIIMQKPSIPYTTPDRPPNNEGPPKKY